MLWWISITSLVISVLAFVLFAVCIIARLRGVQAAGFGDAKAQGDVEGWAKLAEAMAKVIDSLNRAGPAVLALTASIVFMIMSFLAAR
jgi:hypothetical protein